MSRHHRPTVSCFVGPGHARHAATGTYPEHATLCGAEKRRRKDGTLPGTNHSDPFRIEDVNCKRCLKALGAVSP